MPRNRAARVGRIFAKRNCKQCGRSAPEVLFSSDDALCRDCRNAFNEKKYAEVKAAKQKKKKDGLVASGRARMCLAVCGEMTVNSKKHYLTVTCPKRQEVKITEGSFTDTNLCGDCIAKTTLIPKGILPDNIHALNP